MAAIQDYSRSRVLGSFDYHDVHFEVVRTKVDGRPYRKHTALLVDKVPLSTCSSAFPDYQGEVTAEMWHARVARAFTFPHALQDAIRNTKLMVTRNDQSN